MAQCNLFTPSIYVNYIMKGDGPLKFCPCLEKTYDIIDLLKTISVKPFIKIL